MPLSSPLISPSSSPPNSKAAFRPRRIICFRPAHRPARNLMDGKQTMNNNCRFRVKESMVLERRKQQDKTRFTTDFIILFFIFYYGFAVCGQWTEVARGSWCFNRYYCVCVRFTFQTDDNRKLTARKTPPASLVRLVAFATVARKWPPSKYRRRQNWIDSRKTRAASRVNQIRD